MNFLQRLRPRTWLRVRAFAWMFTVLAVLLFKQANPQMSAALLAAPAVTANVAPLPPAHHTDRPLAFDKLRPRGHAARPVTLAARLRRVLEVL